MATIIKGYPKAPFSIVATLLLSLDCSILLLKCTLKVNRKMWLEFELTDFEPTVQHFNSNKVGDCSQGLPKSSLFYKLLHWGIGEDTTPFPGLLHFTLETYLIMLSVKQGGIKHSFWVFGRTQPEIEPRSPGPLANTLPLSQWWLECSLIVWETWVQSQVESYQRLKKWYLMPSC